MKPAWLSWKGLGEHALFGLAVTLLFGLVLAPWLIVALMAAGGIGHEVGDGDFTTEAGAPWNGLLDVLAFLPAPLLWWAAVLIFGETTVE